ncbi:MAG: SUMF1/EgtB/PvdO family nonheme iron enzyme [Planctomycetaceae bacterium]|nr:SUMF1/EgtB/PvdO family nonheme iron enzyme [Planctomycetaceae bacterium]
MNRKLVFMHGNVWEWCSDYFSDVNYSRSPVNNPAGPQISDIALHNNGSC